ncbi:MAG TPA: BON domain-containing protein [Anaerolineales bacterium]|nr:BON domain-containing protein [Anaerolineales bacterium]
MEEVKIGLINQNIRTDEARLRESEIDSLDVRSTPTIWRVEKSGKSNLDKYPTTSDQSAQTFVYPPVKPGQKVYGRDGYAGKVVALRLSPQRQYQSFVVETGRLFRHRYIVPFGWLTWIGDKRVFLSTNKADLKALPEERPDPILVIEVKRALRKERILRGVWIKGIHVSAEHGFIRLHGYVSDSAQKARAEKAVSRISGVLGIENRLVVDRDLKIAATKAVAQIPDVPVKSIFVGAHNGFITLKGEVPSLESRLAAEELAGNVPQIRGVLNTLRVPGLAVEFPEPRALQPAIGARVHATDLVLGHIEQIIINPLNRLVTAILVDGMFSEPRGNRMRWFLDEVIRQRKVVIPVHTIQHMTDTAVFLEVAASQFEDFDPASFVPADTNWQPPYPYHPEHVLLSKPAESVQRNPHMTEMRQISKVLAWNERGPATNV